MAADPAPPSASPFLRGSKKEKNLQEYAQEIKKTGGVHKIRVKKQLIEQQQPKSSDRIGRNHHEGAMASKQQKGPDHNPNVRKYPKTPTLPGSSKMVDI